MKVVIVTGLSGSGKSTAIKALEDIGYFCIDNLPVALLPKFLELRNEVGGEVHKIACGMDLREGGFLSHHKEILQGLQSQGHEFEIIFLESSDDILLRRYSQTRRQHPLAASGDLGVADGIRKERDALKQLKKNSNKVIDTSALNVHELRDVIIGHISRFTMSGRMRVQVLSFGYKYGVPADIDLAFDVRFLPNPYFVEGLRELNGKAPEVKDYVLQWEATDGFLERLYGLLDYLLPFYLKEGKSYLIIAFGCTGGKHRSVAVSCEVYEHIKQWPLAFDVSLRHRDLNLE
ncbi:MAG: RNase adapter RapZ [Pseudomonadota bacterium]